MQEIYKVMLTLPQEVYDALVDRAKAEDRKPGSLARLILKRELLGDVKNVSREPLSMVK